MEPTNRDHYRRVFRDWVHQRDHVERRRLEIVRLARRDGATWTDIGHWLGVSAQAASQRYGKQQKEDRT